MGDPLKRVLLGLGSALVVAGGAVVGGFVLLVLLNGFGERAGGAGLMVYAASAVAAMGVAGGFAWLPIKSLLAKGALGIAVGTVVVGIGFLAGIGPALRARSMSVIAALRRTG